MNNKTYILFSILISAFLINCNGNIEDEKVVAKVVYSKYMSCFPEGTINFDKTEVSLELSGVSYYHDSLFIVSEKEIPGTSSFFAGPFKIPFKRRNLSPISNIDVLNSLTFAGLALTPYQKYLFAVTSFRSGSMSYPAWDNYNMLFYKRLVPPEPFSLAYTVERNEIYSSLDLYPKFKKALRTKLHKKGPPYFEIGGIAAIRENYLLFAISKIGENPNNYENVNIIIGAKYEIIDNEFSFIEEIKELYRFEPDINLNLRGPMALTGIEYDKYNNWIYLLCSYNKGDRDIDLGGYLWVLPMRNFILKKAPILVEDDDGLPISFAHKPGGITVLDKNQILIVFDDDRVIGSDVIIDNRTQFKRKQNEAAYLILEVNKK